MIAQLWPGAYIKIVWVDHGIANGATYSVSRSIGSCSAAQTVIATVAGVPASEYEYYDGNVEAGMSYCYQVSVSRPAQATPDVSNTVSMALPVAPPDLIRITTQ